MEGLSGRARKALGASSTLGGRGAALLFANRAHETKPFPRQRLDQTLLLAAVAYCTSGHIQAGRQCRVRDDAPVPNGRDDIILADDACPVSDEVVEKIKYLRCNGNHVRPAAQLATVGVEHAVFEEIAQVGPLAAPSIRTIVARAEAEKSDRC